MEMRQSLLHLLKRAYEEEQTLVARLSDEQRNAAGEPDAWSVKDIVAHTAAWKERIAGNITATSRGESIEPPGDYNQTNDDIFEENRHLPWADVLVSAERAYRLLAECVQTATDEELADSQPPWQNGRPLWRPIVGTGYTHPITHIGQINAERGEPQLGLRLWQEAANELLRLDDDPEWHGVTRYNLACFYALSDYAEKAIEELGEALKLAPDLTEWSKEDPDFISIREHPDCRALYAD